MAAWRVTSYLCSTFLGWDDAMIFFGLNLVTTLLRCSGSHLEPLCCWHWGEGGRLDLCRCVTSWCAYLRHDTPPSYVLVDFLSCLLIGRHLAHRETVERKKRPSVTSSAGRMAETPHAWPLGGDGNLGEGT